MMRYRRGPHLLTSIATAPHTVQYLYVCLPNPFSERMPGLYPGVCHRHDVVPVRPAMLSLGWIIAVWMLSE